MEQNFIKKIAEIMDDMECRKGFECVKNGFKNIFKTKRFAGEYFTCTGTDSYVCPHVLSFGFANYCTCPLFVYAAKEYHKSLETLDKGFPLQKNLTQCLNKEQK